MTLNWYPRDFDQCFPLERSSKCKGEGCRGKQEDWRRLEMELVINPRRLRAQFVTVIFKNNEAGLTWHSIDHYTLMFSISASHWSFLHVLLWKLCQSKLVYLRQRRRSPRRSCGACILTHTWNGTHFNSSKTPSSRIVATIMGSTDAYLKWHSL